jgi:hypothetical protein
MTEEEYRGVSTNAAIEKPIAAATTPAKTITQMRFQRHLKMCTRSML